MGSIVRANLLIGLCLWSGSGRPVGAEDWPNWRGAGHHDVTSESSGWDGSKWLAGEKWNAAVGEGSSSPIVAGNRVYLMGWAEDQETVYCLDAETGQEYWHQSYQAPRYGRHAIGDEAFYSGVCSTPSFDRETGLLFTLGIDGTLIAWNTIEAGEPVWSLNLYDQYGAVRRPEVAVRKKTQRDYGYVSSPLVLGAQLIVEVGCERGNLVAFDKRSGVELWLSENTDEAGHTGGPVPITVEEVPCVAVLTLRNLVVTRVDPSNPGRTIAIHEWTTDFGNNISTPVVWNDSVLVTSAYNHVAMCRLAITLRGATKVWENELASGVCSPIVHKGHIYWAWRGVHCVDLETGRELWSGGQVGAQGSCLVTSDDRLVVFANKGDLSLVETAERAANAFVELASEPVLHRTDAWPHVVISGGKVICRDRSGMVTCLALNR